MMQWKWYHRWALGWCELIDALTVIVTFGNFDPLFYFKYAVWLTEQAEKRIK